MLVRPIRLPLQKMGINLNRVGPLDSKQLSDEAYIEGLRSGNSQVLSALYKKHYPSVLKLIVTNSGSEEQARDIYQEAVIALYEHAQDPGFTLTCKLQTYLYSVARRLWLKQLNRNGRTLLFKEEEEGELADVSHDVDLFLEKEKEIQRMNQSLEKLGEPCATLIRDFYVARMSMDRISEKFGYTNADNAKTQKYKCLQRLKKYFFEKDTIGGKQEE
jgi:RNA polymerase sigma factor (sigma-70 family)